MARVQSSVFAARKGATLRCAKCGRDIAKGERYYHFSASFRGSKIVRCNLSGCYPRPSELTSSKMSGVYAAIEAAEDALAGLEAGDPESDASSISSILEDAASSIREVADEYREAAEASPTGLIFGEDYNERADSADEIEQWSPEEDEPDFDACDNEQHDDPADRTDEDDDRPTLKRGDSECEGCAEIAGQWWSEQIDSAREALGDASFE